MIDPRRIHTLGTRTPAKPAYVLYWMQQSQRAHNNHAFEHALTAANARHLPLVVYFGLTDVYPDANLRHYAFMLGGLRETARDIRARGAAFVLRREPPADGVLRLATRAALLVMDAGYLRPQRQWRRHVASRAPCPVVEVESDVVVPVVTASDHEQFAARTLRPHLMRLLPEFLGPLDARTAACNAATLDLPGEDTATPDTLLSQLDIDRSVPPVNAFAPGTTAARRALDHFIAHHLDAFADDRNDPARDRGSNMSPYLHFGQISTGEIARAIRDAESPGTEAYLEELIVRRELSMNFVRYNPDYDRYRGLPDWARKTLQAHAADPRPTVYTRAQLEQARTHDPYWNAAQTEMRTRGKMHGYMRMYWGKKILEWSPSPASAFRRALYLNNRYFIDGRDANGFTGVAWCFGKHDRPWTERPIFGNVRYMNANGLRRKFDIEHYVERVNHPLRDAGHGGTRDA